MRGQTNASNIGGTVGDDTHPIKIVNNVVTPVSDDLMVSKIASSTTQSVNGLTIRTVRFDKIAFISTSGTPITRGDFTIATNIQTSVANQPIVGVDNSIVGLLFSSSGSLIMRISNIGQMGFNTIALMY